MDNAGKNYKVKKFWKFFIQLQLSHWWIGFTFLLPEMIISSHVFTFFKLFLFHNLSLWPGWFASKYLAKGQAKIYNFKLIGKAQVILILAFTILSKCHYSVNSQNILLLLLMSYVYMKINFSILYLIIIEMIKILG